jgi:hypothetical protein
MLKVAATCTSSCAACTSSCSLGAERSGSLTPPLPLTVHGHVIYDHTSGKLSFGDAVALYLWSHDEDNVLLKILNLSRNKSIEEMGLSYLGSYLKTRAKLLTLNEITAAKHSNVLLAELQAAEADEAEFGLVERASIFVLVAEIIKEAWNEELVREAMIDDFLLYTRLFPAGFDVDPFATSVPDQASRAFEQEIANYATAYSPFQAGADGIWYQLGRELYTGKDPKKRRITRSTMCRCS